MDKLEISNTTPNGFVGMELPIVETGEKIKLRQVSYDTVKENWPNVPVKEMNIEKVSPNPNTTVISESEEEKKSIFDDLTFTVLPEEVYDNE